MMSDPVGSPRNPRRIHLGYLIAAFILAAAVFLGSLAFFPESAQSIGLLVALVVIIVSGVVEFIANWRSAFEASHQPSDISIKNTVEVQSSTETSRQEQTSDSALVESAPHTFDIFATTSPIHLEFVRVPAGEFLMGSDREIDKDAVDSELPQHRAYVSEF